jgi:8-oxo-dGTP pyrophosphatase MutT (NUDIX family)
VTLDHLPSLAEAEIARQLSRAKGAAGISSETEGHLSGRKAAVLVPMFRAEGGWRLLFTERSQSVEEHPGQVSFPGGKSHGTTEAAVETALRETEEEIGLASDQVRVLGQLDPLETVTGFLVTPIVGAFSWPARLRPSPIEVRDIFHVPLGWLAQASNLQWQPRPKPARGGPEWVPVYQPFEGHVIWGVTARITILFLGALGIDLMPQVQGPRG